jgi:hypothetical protein
MHDYSKDGVKKREKLNELKQIIEQLSTYLDYINDEQGLDN